VGFWQAMHRARTILDGNGYPKRNSGGIR
jgi:hypothetical protein